MRCTRDWCRTSLPGFVLFAVEAQEQGVIVEAGLQRRKNNGFGGCRCDTPGRTRTFEIACLQRAVAITLQQLM